MYACGVCKKSYAEIRSEIIRRRQEEVLQSLFTCVGVGILSCQKSDIVTYLQMVVIPKHPSRDLQLLLVETSRYEDFSASVMMMQHISVL